MNKVIFDGTNKIIKVLPNVTQLFFLYDVYLPQKNQVMDRTSTNAKWAEAIRFIGGQNISNQKRFPNGFCLINGQKLDFQPIDSTIYIYSNIWAENAEYPVHNRDQSSENKFPTIYIHYSFDTLLTQELKKYQQIRTPVPQTTPPVDKKQMPIFIIKNITDKNETYNIFRNLKYKE